MARIGKKIYIVMCFKRRHVIGCKEGACATDDAAKGPAGLVFEIPSRPRQDQDQRPSRPRHFYFYFSTTVLNTSIILFINPSTSVSMLQSNFKNSNNTFLKSFFKQYPLKPLLHKCVAVFVQDQRDTTQLPCVYIFPQVAVCSQPRRDT